MSNYEVQTNTVADGWINTWFDDGTATDFMTAGQAQAAIDEFFSDLTDSDMIDGYDRNDYRIVDKRTGEPFEPGTLERISLVEAMEAATDMHEAAAQIQHAISTPELRDLINILHELYKPSDAMLNEAKYDNAASARAWPDCIDY